MKSRNKLSSKELDRAITTLDGVVCIYVPIVLALFVGSFFWSDQWPGYFTDYWGLIPVASILCSVLLYLAHKRYLLQCGKYCFYAVFAAIPAVAQAAVGDYFLTFVLQWMCLYAMLLLANRKALLASLQQAQSLLTKTPITTGWSPGKTPPPIVKKNSG